VAQLRQMHGLRPRRGGERLATSTRSASGKVGATAGSVPTGADLQQVLKHDAPARAKIEAVHAAEDLDDARKLDLIQKVVIASLQQQVDVTEGGTLPTLLEACDELEELLEMRAEEIMKRLCGMKPKDIGSVGAFIDRLIEAIQMTNDERVQTKENYSRTCVLNTEYVGTLDFKLDAGDQNFLWNKGYITTMLWLQKRSKKAKDKKKKVAKGLAKELIKEASEIKLSAEGASKQAPAPVDGAAKLQGTSAAPSQGSDSGANLELSAQPSEDGGFDPVAGLKGRVSKILSNKTLHSDEKLDIITKLLAQPTPHSTTS